MEKFPADNAIEMETTKHIECEALDHKRQLFRQHWLTPEKGITNH